MFLWNFKGFQGRFKLFYGVLRVFKEAKKKYKWFKNDLRLIQISLKQSFEGVGQKFERCFLGLLEKVNRYYLSVWKKI